MKYVKLVVSIVMFAAIAYLGYQVLSNARQNQQMKQDYAELHNFKYGLFSADAWKDQLSVIITDEIDKLYLTRTNKSTLQSHLEVQLGILIDKVFDRIRKSNKDSPFKQSIMDNFISPKEVKEGIPEYAKAIMAEMSTSKTESQIKGMLKAKIDHYMKATYDTQDRSRKDVIIETSGLTDETAVKEKIRLQIKHNHEVLAEQAMYLIVLAVLLFILEAFTRGPLMPVHYFILTFTLLVMMAVGVLTPMIDMEAKIAHLNFMLFDHPVNFDNQVLYFQSKSIMDVFWVMITHKEIQMKVVAILVVGFSVIFPVLKMLSCLAYYYDFCQAKKYKIINFFVVQSGKWSMADVLVVAIFMAYIGFNGIINSQLETMSEAYTNMELITTNGTSLQPGYYIFLAYVILAMFLSHFIKTRPQQCEVEVQKLD